MNCKTAQVGKVISLNETESCFNFVSPTSFELSLLPGKYFVTLSGASGGFTKAFQVNKPGLGGRTSGVLNLKTAKTFFLFVGGQGGNSSAGKSGTAGFNGGMPGGYDYGNKNDCGSAGSGGSTDLRLNGGSWNDQNGLRSRVMVAGAGGSSGCYYYAGFGGNAGGIDGTAGTSTTTGIEGGKAGTRNSGSNFGYGEKGEDGKAGVNGEACGAGGSGYYGGFGGKTGPNDNGGSGGGGGSSFISGHPGCQSIDINGKPSNSRIHFSGIRFFDTEMKPGVNLGNGKASILRIGSYVSQTVMCKRRKMSSVLVVVLLMS